MRIELSEVSSRGSVQNVVFRGMNKDEECIEEKAEAEQIVRFRLLLAD